MNLIDINTMFPTDEKCRELLTACAGPKAALPALQADAVELETEKALYYCKDATTNSL